MENAKTVLMEHLQILQLGPAFLALSHAQTALAVVIVQDVILGIIFMHISVYQMSQYAK